MIIPGFRQLQWNSLSWFNLLNFDHPPASKCMQDFLELEPPQIILLLIVCPLLGLWSISLHKGVPSYFKTYSNSWVLNSSFNVSLNYQLQLLENNKIDIFSSKITSHKDHLKVCLPDSRLLYGLIGMWSSMIITLLWKLNWFN